MSQIEQCHHCKEDGAPTLRADGCAWFVECVNCYKDKLPFSFTPKDAIAYWNGYQNGCKQKQSDESHMKRIEQLEAALRKLTTVNENQMVSGGWVAQIAREALESADGEMKRFWEPSKESTEPTAPSNSGGWVWTCNACKMDEPCVHMAEAEGWLPKSCIRIGNTIFTSTIRVQCEWKIRRREE